MGAQAKGAGKSVLTPFNVIAGIIVIIGLVIAGTRFYSGIGSVTNLDNNYPWGIWISFDLLCGVVLAAGGYTTSAACYIFGMKRYHSAVRPALLTAFLGYALVVFALMFDLGRPWRLPYPLFYSHGTSSLLFEVGLCVFLYLNVLFVESTPAFFERLGLKKLRHFVHKLTLPLTILGVVLSTMHQSSLGALYLIAPSKVHPLWYSIYLPLFFFISSMFAGMSMVLFESTLAHKKFHHLMDETHLRQSNGVAFGFAKACSWIMAGYFVIKILALAVENKWSYLLTGWGLWWWIEMIGFVAMPCLAYAIGAREKNLPLIRRTALWTVLGIILNRFNVSLVAYNWFLPSSQKYFPSMSEIGISLFVVTLGVLVYRFIVTHMPIFYEHPEYKGH